MTKEELKNPIYWIQLFIDNPFQATTDLLLALIRYDYIDVSRFWRQFYDRNMDADVFRWNSLLVYVAVCGVMYAVLRRRNEGVSALRGFGRYLLPHAVVSARSFRIDLQFYTLQLLKIPAIIVTVASALLFIRLIPAAIVSLHLYDRQPLRSITALLESLPLGWKVFVAYWVAFLAREFGHYWTHRMFHSSKVLWQFHRVHHYGRQMTMLSNARVHPLEMFLANLGGNFTASLALASIFRFDLSGLPPEQALAQMVAVYWWPVPVTALLFVLSRFGHSHVPFSFGVLDRVFVTPAVHIVHHSRDIRDKNFGSVLSIWDTVFGTFHRHDFREPINLGIDEFDDGHYAHCGQALWEPIADAWRVVTLRGRKTISAPDCDAP